MKADREKPAKVTVGIPKALLYFKYFHLWESFFQTLGINYIVSPDTNKDILNKGINYAVDEACLSSKIYLGHVAWLMGKCDYILVPRISSFGKAGKVCTKFYAIYDLVMSTFTDSDFKLINYNIDSTNSENERKAFVKMGVALGKSKSQSLYAYIIAKQTQKTQLNIIKNEQLKLLNKDGIKILIIAHRYTVLDKYIGEPIVRLLKQMGTTPIFGHVVDTKEALVRSEEISKTLPWLFNKELIGALALYKDKVDGIILMTTFPCGPDSLVNEVVIRKIKDKPILNLILDGQEGTAGLETRLESFIDIIKFKRSDEID
ncbi:MAG: hypothetical protein HN948_02910 [Clostridia bacterium]|nr:hypothetical protein [Clostridia bacterium]MBT7121942.1 hypothetical protein [Clostridia bacterium]